MTTFVFWLIPIVLLPGVAMLIMSTATRYGQIHSELHHLQSSDDTISLMFQQHLGQRARFFRNALVSLYISVAVLALGSVIGAVIDMLGQSSNLVVIAFSFVGILCLIFAAYELIRESRLSYQVIAHHLANLMIIEEL